MSNIVVMRVLPPDAQGTRYVRVCWFMIDANGPAQNPSGVIETSWGPKDYEGARGRIACQPQRTSVLPEYNGVETKLTVRSEDPRAVTCPLCKATPEYKAAMAVYEDMA